MRHRLGSVSALLALAFILTVDAAPRAAAPGAAAPSRPTIQQFLKPGFPYELVSAAKADRIAWLSYEEGKRNVYTAAAPDFRPEIGRAHV
mgnify:CR=1 FL=1